MPVVSEEAEVGRLNNVKRFSVLSTRTTASPLFRRKEGQQRLRPSASLTRLLIILSLKASITSQGSEPITGPQGNIHSLFFFFPKSQGTIYIPVT